MSATRGILQFVFAAFVFSGSTVPAWGQLSHLWTFDSDFSDSIGGANGTAIAGPNGSVTITNTAGQYLVGAGGLRITHHNSDTANYVDIPSAVFPTTNPMTFSVNLFYRFDPTTGQDDSRNFLFETTPDFSIGLGQGAADDMEWFFADGPSDTTGPNTNDGNWHQATLVWDKAGSNTASFYHDGVLRDQVNIGAPDFDQVGQAGGLHIGTFRTANDRNWNGYIDQFGIYTHALSPTEVANLYTNAFGNPPPDPTLAFVNALDLVTPVVGANRTVSTVGWGVGSYTRATGSANELGDAGYIGNSFGITNATGDQTITVTLSNLPAHDRVTIDGLLAQLDSLDPVRDGDRFIVRLDGNEIFNEGFGFGVSDDGVNSDPVYADPEGAAVLTNADLFLDGNFNENVYSLGRIDAFRNIAHTGSTLTLEIIGRQNQAAGEFYGLDRLEVSLGTGAAPPEVLGDATGNGIVDEFDFYLISDNLSNNVRFGTLGDVNRDGRVLFDDFRLWKDNATQESLVLLGFETAVPEPSTVALLICALGGMLAVSGKRYFSR
jgi:hypothetical protein